MESFPNSRRLACLAGIALLILAGAVLIVALRELAFDYGRVPAGIILGTSFGQATLIACWTALGPWRPVLRISLCIVWLALLVAAWLAPLGPGIITAVTIPAAIIGQSLVAQFPLWLLALRWGVFIYPAEEAGARPALSGLQFRIKEVMVLTAIIAAVLGLGRVVVPLALKFANSNDDHETPAFAFVVIANLFMTMPLAVAVVLPRHALPATAAGLALVAFATLCELSVLGYLIPAGRNPDPDVVAMFWIMNFSQATWILTVLSLLRLGGYRLTAKARA